MVFLLLLWPELSRWLLDPACCHSQSVPISGPIEPAARASVTAVHTCSSGEIPSLSPPCPKDPSCPSSGVKWADNPGWAPVSEGSPAHWSFHDYTPGMPHSKLRDLQSSPKCYMPSDIFQLLTSLFSWVQLRPIPDVPGTVLEAGLFVNSLIKIPLTSNKLCTMKVYNLIRFDIHMHLGQHLYSENIYHL